MSLYTKIWQILDSKYKKRALMLLLLMLIGVFLETLSIGLIIPLVSIIIPTYNQAKYIGKALQSIIDQTFKNWEAIIIDNHSTDDTQKVLNQFVDSRIKCLKVNNNGIIAIVRSNICKDLG